MGSGHVTGIFGASVLGCRLNRLQTHRENPNWLLERGVFAMRQPSPEVCRCRNGGSQKAVSIGNEVGLMRISAERSRSAVELSTSEIRLAG
jgi:hypothetical protein